MKIAVIGAGIIGITTAYALALRGHEVTVFERRSTAAEEASFAHAGVLAPGYFTPWAAPGMPLKVLRHVLLGNHAPVGISLPLGRSDIAWMRQWLKACSPEGYLANRRHVQHLAHYSRQCLHQISADLNAQYERSQGYMLLLRSIKEAKWIEPGLAMLHEAGVSFNKISAAQARVIEPGLSPHTDFLGAVHLPDDEVANCRQFALLLRGHAQQKGVNFGFNTAVARIESAQAASQSIAKVWLEGQKLPQVFDRVVLCAGVASAALAEPLGIALPVAAVYGYSISLPLREVLDAPKSGLLDERYRVAITRLGNRIRVAGGAQLGGQPDAIRAASVKTLYKVLQDWFPASLPQAGANLGSHAQVWKGACPTLPDGPPAIGATRLPAIWLNTGHGSSGWALACGSARLLADLMEGLAPDIDAAAFSAGRFQA